MLDIVTDAALSSLLSAWRRAPLQSYRVPEMGTIHRTFLLQTDAAVYVLRAYRPVTRAYVECEHAVITYANGWGVPTPLPLPLLDGSETILEREGRFYALFPFIEDRQVPREDLSPVEIAAAGSFLADLHSALSAYPREKLVRHSPTQPGEQERASVLIELDRLEAIITASPQPSSSDAIILAHLRARRQWVRQARIEGVPALSCLEQQVIHGDYQEANLFFNGSKVSGIIDWDKAYCAPRAWEVVRALHLMCNFAPAPSQAFIAAYRARQPLALSELEIAGAAYVANRLSDLWAYREIYLEHNDRVRKFFRSERFISPSQRWEECYESIKTIE